MGVTLPPHYIRNSVVLPRGRDIFVSKVAELGRIALFAG